MASRIPTKRSLPIELARAREVWPEIKATPEFWVGLGLFVVLTLGVAMLGFFTYS
jgi:hypothetical protein